MNILIKDKNPIKLLTEKKYLEEDINIQAETEELDITPTTENQIKEGLYDKVIVAGDSNLVAGNIKKGTSIFGVEGTLSGELTGTYAVKIIDYDGTIIKEEKLAEGDVFEMPSPPQHDNLIFQGWSSPVDIIDNKIMVENHDVIAGPMYTTISGTTEFDIELTKVTGLTVALQNLTGITNIDWGDGAINTQLTHTYTNYGKYTVNVYGVTKLGSYVFKQSTSAKNCTLKKVRLSNDVITIDTNAFNSCYSLTTITMPESLTNVNDSAFNTCYSLTNIILPKNLINIGSNAFYSCCSLTNIIIPESITVIKTSTFCFCYALTDVILPENLTQLGNDSFKSCFSLSNIILPKKLTNIGNNAFYNCYALIDIIIPENVISLGNGGFNTCYSLTNIIIPDNISVIDMNTFVSCYSLTNVILPENLTDIKAYAFSACHSVMSYDFSKVKIVPALASTSGIRNINQVAKIIVPDELYDEWIVATNWSTYADYIYKKSEVIE